MLSVAEKYLNNLDPNSRLEVFGQEINSEPDYELRDYENVPLIAVPEKDAFDENMIDQATVNEYFRREVLPHVSDAWIDWDKTKVG